MSDIELLGPELRKGPGGLALWFCPGCKSGWRTPDAMAHLAFVPSHGELLPALCCSICHRDFWAKHGRPAQV